MNQLIQNTEGLKTEHQNKTPLFEKSYFPPDYGAKQVSRLYDDGSLYFFILSNKSKNTNEDAGKWGYISTVKDSGIQKIKEILKNSFNLVNDKLDGGNVKGIVVWRIPFKNEVKEIVTTIIPESKHVIFNEIGNIVNANLNPIPSDKEK